MQPTGHTTSVQYDPLALMELWRDLERTKYPRALDLLTSDNNIYYLTPINLFLCKQGLSCQFHWEILDPSLHLVARTENKKQRYPKKYILCQRIKSSGSESNYRSILDYIQLNPQILWFMMIIRPEYTSFIKLLSAGPKVYGKQQGHTIRVLAVSIFNALRVTRNKQTNVFCHRMQCISLIKNSLITFSLHAKTSWAML